MKVHGINQNVFPLTKIDALLSGYFMDVSGNVWSNRNGGARIMQGSRQPSGRYYTLANRSFNADNLKARCTNHADWVAEILGSPSNTFVAKPATLPGRTTSAKEAIAKKSLVLATVGDNDRLHFATDPVFHDTLPQARTEAERIAMAVGKKVVVLQVVGAVQIQKASWE